MKSYDVSHGIERKEGNAGSGEAAPSVAVGPEYSLVHIHPLLD